MLAVGLPWAYQCYSVNGHLVLHQLLFLVGKRCKNITYLTIGVIVVPPTLCKTFLQCLSPLAWLERAASPLTIFNIDGFLATPCNVELEHGLQSYIHRKLKPCFVLFFLRFPFSVHSSLNTRSNFPGILVCTIPQLGKT